VPWSKLPAVMREAVLHGAEAQAGRGKKRGAYEGIITRLERLLASGEAGVAGEGEEDDGLDDEVGSLGDELGRFVVTRVCDACGGRRLRPEALAVRRSPSAACAASSRA
jgi:excinuclease ABC subunit A